MRTGGVQTQILPVYVPNSNDPHSGEAQVSSFKSLLTEHHEDYVHYFRKRQAVSDNPMRIALAVENAVAFFGDDEAVADGLDRLREVHRLHGPLVYVSMTWALENRFGGGNCAQNVGIKPDGRDLLDMLARESIPVDVSHASDILARDILDFLDENHPCARVMASHCNFRAVKEHPRNITDELALEVAARGGVIGLNLIKAFVGEDIKDFSKHVGHGLSIGLGDKLCIGADFFCPEDLPSKPLNSDRFFFENFGTAACHPDLQLLLKRSGFSEERLCGLAHLNLQSWLGDF